MKAPARSRGAGSRWRVTGKKARGQDVAHILDGCGASFAYSQRSEQDKKLPQLPGQYGSIVCGVAAAATACAANACDAVALVQAAAN